MLKVENRESAHLRSRVKDLSVVPNVASFNGLFAAITPIAKAAKNAEGLYEPVLVRDNETLIANFGDPRIDPEKYIDLYSIMQVVGNGGTCYVAKVNSGNAGVYQFPFLADPERLDDTESGDTKQLKPYEGDDEPANTYYFRVKNKYIVTSVKGYDDNGDSQLNFIFYSLPFSVIGEDGTIDESNADLENATGIPSGEPIDYTGRYTWKCIPYTPKEDEDEDLRFEIRITLTEAPDTEHPVDLVAFGVVDPSWGAEPLIFKPATKDSIVNDSDNKVTYVTFESDGDVENAYVITKFADSYTVDGAEPIPFPDALKGTIYDTELVGKTLKLTFTVPYTEGVDPAPAITTIAGIKLKAEKATRKSHSMIAYSSMAEELTFKVYLSQVKPYSLKAYYLNIEVANNGGANTLGAVKIKLEQTTTNQGLVNAFNSALGTVVRFELMDPETGSACCVKERGANSIANALLETYCNVTLRTNVNLDQPIVIEAPSYSVSVNDYINALMQYKAKKYVGCLMADMVCPVTHDLSEEGKPTPHEDGSTYPLNDFDRRSLHYKMKDIAFERKDTTVILSTPYTPSYNNLTPFTIQDACDWVASQGAYADLWEYGQGATTDYATQSFYLEMYYSWLEMQCNWIVNGAAKSKKVKVAPSNLVINNVLTSWRERGVQYPVAGDQGGVLPETCTILMNPKTKLERDQLVQYRINPIWDTGTRGIQIFGNETLNAGYTDLNAAHIARTLVYIRSTIDEYTEKLKFSINNLLLWDKWKTYVTQYILEPLLAVNAISEYRVAMGEDTTSREEIANRTINGVVQLIFYQSAEIFDLTYVVYSSATTIDEAMANT